MYHRLRAGPTPGRQRGSKTYQVPEREGGFGAAVRSFVRRHYSGASS